MSVSSSTSIDKLNFDKNDRLSIVVQGGIFSSNLIETAVHCQHWRNLFPAARIILSISITDCLIVQPLEEICGRPRLIHSLEHDGQKQAAVTALVAACDLITVSAGALPLPSIKIVTEAANNINLQIAASQHGLSKVSTPYVLRIRNDMVFSGYSFLDQYLDGQTLPRGDAAVLTERVLISSLFTLNPYTVERLPLHFSDWFHFGLTKDVRRLWDVPDMTFAESVFYRTHEHTPDANFEERTIVPRRAVEQHLAFHAFRKHFPTLSLDFHNDRTSIELANDILVDNFIVCDLSDAKLIFKKYQDSLDHAGSSISCITSEDWKKMVLSTAQMRRQTLQDKCLLKKGHVRDEFPIRVTSPQLSTKNGLLIAGSIVKGSEDGVLLHGPYISISPGRYRAVVDVDLLVGLGIVTLRATLDEGRVKLAERVIAVGPGDNQYLQIAFDIDDNVGHKLEIICETKGIDELVVSGLTLFLRDADEPPIRSWSLWPGYSRLRTLSGRILGGKIQTTGISGVLVYGPYIELPRGRFHVSFSLSGIFSLGQSHFTVTADRSPIKSIGAGTLNDFGPNGTVDLEFTLTESTKDIEFRVEVDAESNFELGRIIISWEGPA